MMNNKVKPIDFFWIYALVATEADSGLKACYIGQTNNIKRRMHDHFAGQWGGGIHQTVIGRSSSLGLFAWAKLRGINVSCVALSFLECTRSDAEQFEGHWIQLALDAKYEMPGYFRQPFLPLPSVQHNQPSAWPELRIQQHALPISKVVNNNLEPVLITEKFSVALARASTVKAPTLLEQRSRSGEKWTVEEESRLVAHFLRYGDLRRLQTVHRRPHSGIRKKLIRLSESNKTLFDTIAVMKKF